MGNQIKKVLFLLSGHFPADKQTLVFKKLKSWENLYQCGIPHNNVLLFLYTKGAGVVLQFFISQDCVEG